MEEEEEEKSSEVLLLRNKMISSDGACNSRAYVAAATGSPLHGIAFPLRFFAVERFAPGLFGW